MLCAQFVENTFIFAMMYLQKYVFLIADSKIKYVLYYCYPAMAIYYKRNFEIMSIIVFRMRFSDSQPDL